ncbi:hypothetical protein OOU_Y34scaffold00666g70 [Pyricularia oryzae Y34]|uniref:Myosin class II heavy chain n=1 Tax=Pyricularia oryzae (strain Y34) TaxID=1143189 RepID=A0AA97NU10_PYRO3|nr:hypothetical protein OOU_Y34scaffold00666g70 [Pyricularia oryzae Y34]
MNCTGRVSTMCLRVGPCQICREPFSVFRWKINDAGFSMLEVVGQDRWCYSSQSKLSSPKIQSPPGATAQENTRDHRALHPSSPRSPAVSTTSTADGDASPILPPLQAPRLPDRVQQLLRTPPRSRDEDRTYVTASWGSPYPKSESLDRLSSLSSASSADSSPGHHLEIQTPFLRLPPSLIEESPTEQNQPSFVSAAILANRARRPARGLTEDWIRQHTSAGDGSAEARHWLSDGAGDSENSSLSGSISGEEAAWFNESDLKTPRATTSAPRFPRSHQKYPRTRSSNETLKQADVQHLSGTTSATMASESEPISPEGLMATNVTEKALPEPPSTPKLSEATMTNGFANSPLAEKRLPQTPKKSPMKQPPPATPRLRKKVPWKGKNIMILLPRDGNRGKPGHAPLPLNEQDVAGIMKSWEELGYSTKGFHLDDTMGFIEAGNQSQSRREWPTWEDLASDRQQRNYKVTLPDLNAWKSYVEELQEAKLRALGVSFGDDDPPSSVSPAPISRQPSVTHYPPLPFSPPLPTSSAASNGGFPFPASFLGSGAPSPGIPSVPSPVSFNGRFPRQSISIPAGAFHMNGSLPSPHGYSPQSMFHHGHARGGSPSLANLSSMMSPTSPFQPDHYVPPMHTRHQSMQFPMLGHQVFQGARASPRLQELREDDEEPEERIPIKPLDADLRSMNKTGETLQGEIDGAMQGAEYHLEEQMRSQLEHDKDYSPHKDADEMAPSMEAALAQHAHARGPSVQFAPQVERFREDGTEGGVLHHPQPHSRGHSLSQKYFQEPEGDSTDDGGSKSQELASTSGNIPQPLQSMDFEFPEAPKKHQSNFSMASNPWSEAGSVKSHASRRLGHKSQASLSGLNVEAPEFKFNPGSSFQPSQFSFTSDSFQPTTVFQAGTPTSAPKVPLSADSSTFSFGSKINATAPVFSPGQSDFSFSASGPKFRPDAPTFTPLHSFTNSLTSPPMSGNEGPGGNLGGSIFGTIDLSASDVGKAPKKTKAIPIVRPQSREKADEEESKYDEEGRVIDDTRTKRAKARSDDGDDVPLFAEPTAPTPMTEAQPEDLPQSDNIHVDVKSGDENGADTTVSSAFSDNLNAKAANSPPPLVPPQTSSLNWTPFEFKSQVDVQAFNSARPFGEDAGFKRQHKKTLSATAQPFIPSGFMFTGPKADSPKAEVDEATADEATADETEQETADERQTAGEPEAHVTDREDVEEETREETAEAESLVTSELPAPTADIDTTPPKAGAMAPPAKKGLSASRYAASPSPPPQRKVSGLSASRYAASPPPASEEDTVNNYLRGPTERGQPLIITPPAVADLRNQVEPPEQTPASERAGASFEEIDDIMRYINNDPSHGVNRTIDAGQWHQPSPKRHISLAAVTNNSPLHLAPNEVFRSDAPSPSPARHRLESVDAQQPILSTELEDPFVDQPTGSQFSGSNIHHLQGSETAPDSDWERAFSDEQHEKLESRVNFFDGHVNEVVGRLLASRLRPLEKALDSIQHAVSGKRPTSSRMDRRSMSVDIQHSDADDEDEEVPAVRRSLSPRRDRRLDQIRTAVMEALAIQQRNTLPAPPRTESDGDISAVKKAIEEMREQFGKSLHLDFRGEDLRNIVEDAVERRMVPTPQPVAVKGQEDLSEKFNELQAKAADLEQRLRLEEAKVETELVLRRTAEDRAAEFQRNLEMAETKIEVEIMNRSVYDQRVHDLEERLKHQEVKAEQEASARRTAEDRLAENQRLLRISSEEETRLREALEEKEQKIKSIEESKGKTTMRLALLEASQTNNQQSQADIQNKMNATETELREARQDARTWKAEAERVNNIARQQGSDLAQVNEQNKHLKKIIDTLGTQLEENERIRETWRGKFVSLQNDMTDAAAKITEESAHRIKKEQELLARQEVLDAKLQAEARTRERLESELERLEAGERQGIRAVNECKRLDTLLAELKTENHQLQQSSMRYQIEFQEARDSAAREVQRTRDAMQSQIDQANHEVNVVREELEDQVQRVRAQLDQVKLDADTSKAKYEMLLEDAQATHKTEMETLARKHQVEIEDLQERHERIVNNTTEDAQRLEQNLLERLSISTSKSTNLQERIQHLEERLEIAKEAAAAAARAAKLSPVALEHSLQSPPLAVPAAARSMDLPEKISPQALRESIMVLQEQLQAREQTIEELEHQISKLDPEAETKITKRDDEIVWLRELLAVRHSDLQDVIAALDSDDYDRNAVKDAAIRLKANLQMEEQERERAMNGGSAINLPNIAASLRDAATPRVAQAVGPLAAAWGNWRKSREPSNSSSPAVRSGHRSTPSRNNPTSQSNLFSGLMTPPASGLRQTPQSQQQQQQQPTAFSSTGRRMTAQQLASRSRTMSSSSSASRSADNKMLAAQGTPSRGAPRTPPMMRPSSYDADAHAEEFDDAGFYDDE